MTRQLKPATHAAPGTSEVLQTLEKTAVETAPVSVTGTFTRNALLSVARLFVTTVVSLVLPAYLAHRLPIQTYSAWVLILQMSAYVSYLDFGVQTGVAKYVAEHHARGDVAGANARASAGLAIMAVASLLGALLTIVLAWRVPQLFHQMPAGLYADARVSLLAVGISLSFGLLCSVFSAIFVGLQRYQVPVALAVLNRLLFAACVCAAVSWNNGLRAMGLAVAAVNVLTGLLQIVAWNKLAGQIRLSLRRLDYTALRQMLGYCGVLAIWSAGMLCVSGLDVTLVGRYDYAHTAFYSIATLPTNFILAILGAALGPLMPSASALSTQRSPEQMGGLLARTTRYSTVVLLVSGLPLIVAAYPVLHVWVGANFAFQTMQFLRVLMFASILRNLCAPYATVLVALESQRVAVAGAIAEAVVNLGSSLYLVRHMGAIGVAYGTVLGSIVSIFFHFVINMRQTYPKLAITAPRLFVSGLLRPATIALPSLLLAGRWMHQGPPTLTPAMWVLWAGSTGALAWYAGLDRSERVRLVTFLRSRLPGSHGAVRTA